MSGTACSGSLVGISGILQEEPLVIISRLHEHLSVQFWGFTVIYYRGERKKRIQFEQIKGQTSPFSLDHDEPAQPEQEQPRARGSSDTQELLPTTRDAARLLNQDPALP